MNDRVSELESELAGLRIKCDAMERDLEVARHYRDAIEAAPVSIFRVSGAKGSYVFVNDAFARLIGRTRDDLMTLDPFQVWVGSAHPEDVEPERAEMGRMAKGEVDRFQIEKRVISIAGQTRWVRMDAAQSRLAISPVGLELVTAYFTDVEEQREMARWRGEAARRNPASRGRIGKLGAVGKLAGVSRTTSTTVWSSSWGTRSSSSESSRRTAPSPATQRWCSPARSEPRSSRDSSSRTAVARYSSPRRSVRTR